MIDRSTMDTGAIIRGDEALVNLYDCHIGANTTIAPFVEVQADVRIGADSKISSHSFICTGVRIGDRVFIGHGVMFTNDLYPTIIPRPGYLAETVVEDDAVIGSGATILPVRIGRGAIIGAGAVCVTDVPALCIVAGNPAVVTREFQSLEERDAFIDGHNRQRLSRQRG